MATLVARVTVFFGWDSIHLKGLMVIKTKVEIQSPEFLTFLTFKVCLSCLSLDLHVTVTSRLDLVDAFVCHSGFVAGAKHLPTPSSTI